jgi:hypothetical protein
MGSFFPTGFVWARATLKPYPALRTDLRERGGGEGGALTERKRAFNQHCV